MDPTPYLKCWKMGNSHGPRTTKAEVEEFRQDGRGWGCTSKSHRLRNGMLFNMVGAGFLTTFQSQQCGFVLGRLCTVSCLDLGNTFCCALQVCCGIRALPSLARQHAFGLRSRQHFQLVTTQAVGSSAKEFELARHATWFTDTTFFQCQFVLFSPP